MFLLRTEWGGLDVAALFGADEAHAGHANARGAEGPLGNRRRRAQRGLLLCKSKRGSRVKRRWQGRALDLLGVKKRSSRVPLAYRGGGLDFAASSARTRHMRDTLTLLRLRDLLATGGEGTTGACFHARGILGQMKVARHGP
jgi:hypothetical protein